MIVIVDYGVGNYGKFMNQPMVKSLVPKVKKIIVWFK